MVVMERSTRETVWLLLQSWSWTVEARHNDHDERPVALVAGSVESCKGSYAKLGVLKLWPMVAKRREGA